LSYYKKIEEITEHILEHLLAGQEQMMARVKVEMESNHKEMTESLEAKVDSHYKKFEVLQGTFISWMDIHQARTEAIEEEIIVQMDAHQERMGTSVNAWQKETTACQEATEACL
jgi:fatty-acid desaturase